jgi:hypothetical protein
MSAMTMPATTRPLADAAHRLRARPGRKPSATADAHSKPKPSLYVPKITEQANDRAEAPITSCRYDLLTVREAAAYLRCSTWFVRQLVQGGYLSPIKLPAPITLHRRSGELRKVLIDRAQIDRLIAQGKAARQTA